MTPFGYLVVFVSLVLALGVTRLLRGFGQLLQASRRGDAPRLYWVHLCWTVILLLVHVNFWWALFQFRGRGEWAYYQFVLLVAVPALLYLAAVLVFPEPGRLDGDFDFRDYFYANHTPLFLAVAGVTVLNFLILLSTVGVGAGGPALLQVGSYAVSVLLMLAGAWTDSESYHGLLAAVTLLFVAGLNIAASGQTVIG